MDAIESNTDKYSMAQRLRAAQREKALASITSSSSLTGTDEVSSSIGADFSSLH
jgi:hypothetical protein